MSTFGIYKCVKIRKKHSCVLCGRTIPLGKKAWNNTGMFEGDWQNWYMCIPCNDNIEVEYGEDISDEDFSTWLYSQPDSSKCPSCGEESYIDWDFSANGENVEFECGECDHKWEKHIGFDAKEKL